ncbi:MAG: hypothetical protein MRZ60_08640 [Blautia sp.]|nr:hypothetical protein [Blautia sp.]
MTPREKFIKCLKREPITGHVPHFELVFFLTMEAIGKIHPQHRCFDQWDQMSRREQDLHVKDIAETYIETAEKYDHSAIFVQMDTSNMKYFDRTVRILEEIRNQSGDKYYTMVHGDPTFAIPTGDDMIEFSALLYEEEDKMKALAQKNVDHFKAFAEKMAKHEGLLDGFTLCSDYCFNTNPFFSPDLFAEYITPYLKDILDTYRSMGFYTIKHTDGNIMPILDQMVECGPDALHSIDPQGGVSLKKVKELVGDKVALCGNVNCGLLQTGTLEECEADIRRSLREGMPGYGYIFCTSNCAYTGLSLERYELMHRIWREEGIYPIEE